MRKKSFLWEVRCVESQKSIKDFGYGIHRSYYKKVIIKEKCKVFTKKADALTYLYALKQQGYAKSYINRFYG